MIGLNLLNFKEKKRVMDLNFTVCLIVIIWGVLMHMLLQFCKYFGNFIAWFVFYLEICKISNDDTVKTKDFVLKVHFVG